jgi:hypothetical protein
MALPPSLLMFPPEVKANAVMLEAPAVCKEASLGLFPDGSEGPLLLQLRMVNTSKDKHE